MSKSVDRPMNHKIKISTYSDPTYYNDTHEIEESGSFFKGRGLSLIRKTKS